MIEKRLFFIWIGEKVYNFVEFAINAFKNKNPDFEIEYIHEKSVYNSNIDFKECMDQISDKSSMYHRIYYTNWKKHNLSHNRIQKNIRFSDVLRYYLINKYGGIYLDCDTYPIKPFDDKLLSKNYFKCANYDNKKILSPDVYFIGCKKNNNFNTKPSYIITTNSYNRKSLIKISYNYYKNHMKNYNNFLNCKNKFNLRYCFKNEYIIHFKTLLWKNK